MWWVETSPGRVHPMNLWYLELLLDVTSTETAQWTGLWVLVFCGFCSMCPPLICVHFSHWTSRFASRAMTHVCLPYLACNRGAQLKVFISIFLSFVRFRTRTYDFQGPRLWECGRKWSQETCTDPVWPSWRLRDGMASPVQEHSP